MPGSVLKLTIQAIGETRDEVIEKLDEICNQTILEQGGEPWVVLADEVKKIVVDLNGLLQGNPSTSYFDGTRTLVFAGPTRIGPSLKYHDGFRPQAEDEPLI